jgi:hypothetical protein
MSRRNELEAARRVRAGMIGVLESCRCTYPMERHPTSTEHDDACPAHWMTLSARAAAGDGHAGAELARCFICPRCRAVSHNPNDKREGYCGRCHDFTAVTS